MMKTQKIAWVLLLLLIFLPKYGQAQIKTKEVIAVHLSKNIAVTGESVWFYMQVLDQDLNSLSKMAYAELINREGNPVHQVIIPLIEGKAEGYIEVPADIESDNYLLRFYTRISPIQSNNGVFNQFITVLNPQKPPRVRKDAQAGKTYAFDKASMVLPELKFKIDEEINLDLSNDSNGKLASVSVSIRNPYLSENHSGYINGEIYRPLDANTKLIPELYGHIVLGKNLNPKIDTTETFFLSSHGTQSFLSSAKPKENGDLYFEIGALKSFNYLVAQSSDIEKQLNFMPESPFLPFKLRDDFKFPVLVLEEKDRLFLSRLVTAAKVSSYFYPNEDSDFAPIVTGFEADKTYIFDDYTRFENLQVTLKEYVPEVLVRKQDKKTLFKLLNIALGSVFQENPLILIDAMPVFDTDALAAFDPVNIKMLEVMSREFLFNQEKYEGVMSFTSFKNDFGGFPLPSNALYLNYPKIQKPRKPASPHLNPNLDQVNFPDFRTPLYWNPNQELSTAFPIFSSEIADTFEISIGIREGSGKIRFVKQAILIEK